MTLREKMEADENDVYKCMMAEEDTWQLVFQCTSLTSYRFVVAMVNDKGVVTLCDVIVSGS